jgi:hypothetical protein
VSSLYSCRDVSTYLRLGPFELIVENARVTVEQKLKWEEGVENWNAVHVVAENAMNEEKKLAEIYI